MRPLEGSLGEASLSKCIVKIEQEVNASQSKGRVDNLKMSFDLCRPYSSFRLNHDAPGKFVSKNVSKGLSKGLRMF